LAIAKAVFFLILLGSPGTRFNVFSRSPIEQTPLKHNDTILLWGKGGPASRGHWAAGIEGALRAGTRSIGVGDNRNHCRLILPFSFSISWTGTLSTGC
jgi:hypothetical protein